MQYICHKLETYRNFPFSFQNFHSTILCTTIILYREVPYKNISNTKISAHAENPKLHAALFTVHKQAHIYVYTRQALHRSINMWYASA